MTQTVKDIVWSTNDNMSGWHGTVLGYRFTVRRMQSAMVARVFSVSLDGMGMDVTEVWRAIGGEYTHGKKMAQQWLQEAYDKAETRN